MRPRTALVARLAAPILVLAAPGFAATLDVPGDHPDIATALAAALPGDEVVVAAGTYYEHDLILPSGVVLRGATGNPADVVVDGERAGRCVYGAGLDAATRLEALTLANGLPALGSTPHNSWGGALMVEGGEPTVANCAFTGNETAIGGGAFVTGTGSPVFVDCVFDGNQATESAGLLVLGTCDPQVRNCVFRNGDRTTVGGGLTWAGSGHALIEGCVFEDNAVWETGGGVEILGAAAVATLRSCAIRRNSADLGAGGLIVTNGAHAILEACEIVDNGAADYAGGVVVGFDAVLEAFGTTIIDNTAPNGPDGLIGSTASATLTCCVVAAEAWQVLGSLVIDDEGCAQPDEDASWGGIKSLYR